MGNRDDDRRSGAFRPPAGLTRVADRGTMGVERRFGQAGPPFRQPSHSDRMPVNRLGINLGVRVMVKVKAWSVTGILTTGGTVCGYEIGSFEEAKRLNQTLQPLCKRLETHSGGKTVSILSRRSAKGQWTVELDLCPKLSGLWRQRGLSKL